MTEAELERPRRLRGTPSWLITQTAARAHRLVADAHGRVDARRYHYALLAALEEFGPSSQRGLARRCGIDPGDIVGAVNELVALDQVERSPDPAHRRRNVVAVTVAGRRQLEVLDGALAEAQDALLAGLTADERQVLVDLLGKVLLSSSIDVPGRPR